MGKKTVSIDNSREGEGSWLELFFRSILRGGRSQMKAVDPRRADPGEVASPSLPLLVAASDVQSGGRRRESSLAGKRAAVVLFSFYPNDARPRRAAEALAHEGMHVELLCLRHDSTVPAREQFMGVDVTRLPLRRRRGGKVGYMLRYLSFIVISGSLLAFRSLRRRYDLVHVHNMPDVLVFSSLVPKLLGARVILDLHDPMPELMTTIFDSERKSFSVRLMQRLEKWSIRFADSAVTVNLACQKLFCSRSCRPEKLQIVMNSPDEEAFGFQGPARPAPTRNGPFVIMYHGSLIERNGLDLGVQALQIVRRTVPQAVLRIYGQNTAFLQQVMETVKKDGLLEAVEYLGEKSVTQIAQAIDECDVGIIPNRRSIFAELNTPTRIFEYLARGKPVIAPRAHGIVDYFREDQIIFFELGNPGDLAQKLKFVVSAPEKVTEIVRRGQEVYLAHTWSKEREGFVSLVRDLLLKDEGASSDRPSVRR